MRFDPTPLNDAFLIETDLHRDFRGSFSRLRCSREFAGHGLPGTFVQTDLSCNIKKGTFRGMHYQVPPSREGKLVRCILGSVRDVIVDLRPDSTTFLRHFWVTLSADRFNALFVPAGFAHGFLTREDQTFVLYEMTDYYSPELARGMRWDDPLLGLGSIDGIEVIHSRDADYPDVRRTDLDAFRS